ncbi:MAG: thiamine-phosphate kinase [Bacteroidia bacterium]|nr:thiamine-phosphate kinase [Bacteroidia bacterium]
MLDNSNIPPRTELERLGEFGLIDYLTKNIKLKHQSSIKGVGDDAAVLGFDEGFRCIVTTDMLIEGVHFDLSYTPLKHLGYKSVMVNVSDLAAMNAQARQITVSIAISNRFSLEALDELYQGIYLACEREGIDVVGGDTISSTSGLIISITAIGQAKEEDIVYRNTAQENDLIVVSGDLGGAYVGLQLLEREKQVFLSTNQRVQPDLEGNDYILERQLKPEARTDITAILKKLQVKPTAMIDISDGLSSEIMHICKQSDKGCNIFEDKIPIDPTTYNAAREFNLDPTVCALNGGEDYELLFTMNLSDFDKIKGNPNLTVIGHITEKAQGYQLITKSGSQHPLTAQGWNAFSEGEEKHAQDNQE